MGKPFKITTPGDPGVLRGPAGRFVPASPPQIVQEAHDTGVDVIDVVKRNQAPEHPTPGGKQGIADEKPWPATAPVRPPMRVK